MRDSKVTGRESKATGRESNLNTGAGGEENAMATISEDDDTEMWKQAANENKSFISDNAQPF